MRWGEAPSELRLSQVPDEVSHLPRLLCMFSLALSFDSRGYSAVISTCERSSQWHWSTDVLEQFSPTQDELHDSETMSPEAGAKQIALNAALSACQKSLQWTLAMEIFQDMPRSTSAPSELLQTH